MGFPLWASRYGTEKQAARHYGATGASISRRNRYQVWRATYFGNWKPLRCRLGWHKWQERRFPSHLAAHNYEICSWCEKRPRTTPST